jgi:hypothetical protein
MKWIITLILVETLFFSTSIAQVPQGISYQAIAFNTEGSPVVNRDVSIKISILDNSITGTTVYSETHVKTTNSQGLFNLNIGQGSPTLGIFSDINWASNSKFLKVELDPNGGTNYVSVGTNQLMSAPYALFAENVNLSNLPVTVESGSQTSEIIVIYTATTAYGFSQYSSNGAGEWISQSLSGTPIGAIASGNNIVVYTTTNAYGFSQFTSNGAGNWTPQSLSGTPIGAVASGNNIVVYTTTNAYGFSQFTSNGAGDWTPQSLSGTQIRAIASGNNIVIYTSTNAYGFSQFSTNGAGDWISQSLSSTPIGAIGSSKNIVVYTATTAYGFSQFSTNGAGDWISQSLSGTPIEIVTR